MKNKLKSLNLGILIFGISLLLINCQNEEINTDNNLSNESINPYQINTVNIEQIPNISNHVNNISNRSIISRNASSRDEVAVAIFDVDNIIEVIDTLNQANYSFRFEYDDTPPNIFYNLVVGVNPDGEEKEPYVLKYITDEEHLDVLVENDFDFNYFNGTVNLYPFGAFFESSDFQNRNSDCEYDQYGDPCIQTVVTNTGSTGSSSSSSGSSSASGPGTSTGTTGSTSSYGGTPSSGSATLVWRCCFFDGCDLCIKEMPTTVWQRPSTANTASRDSNDCNCDISVSGGVGVSLPKTIQKLNIMLGLGTLDDAQQDYLINNLDQAKILLWFLINNGNSSNNQAFVLSSINILSEPTINPSNIIDYKQAIQRLTNHLRLFGNVEDEIYADYIDSLLPDMGDMYLWEVKDIYWQVKQTCNDLTLKYAQEIITVVVTDLVIPVVSYALFQATAGTAIKLLQKTPLPAVLVGTRLNKMVQRVAQLGVQGQQEHVTIVATSSPVAKAEELFISLTRNAVSVAPPNAQGTIVANMGNGNFITFRTVSSSNFPATINLNFPSLFGSTPRAVKFKTP